MWFNLRNREAAAKKHWQLFWAVAWNKLKQHKKYICRRKSEEISIKFFVFKLLFFV